MNVLKAAAVLLLSLMSVTVSFAQNTPVRGIIQTRIINEKQQNVEGASVLLLNAGDSAVIKTVISDKDGKASINKIPAGKYILSAAMIGYHNAVSAAFSFNGTSMQIPSLQMVPSAQTLKDVTVETKKPFMEQQLGKTVINVESSIVSSGSSAMDILERSPGVTVDQSDNISLKGKQGVLVMIDGKPAQISGTDLANMLRAMPSNTIDKIELITNPNSKYDAAGTGGIINIKLKKNQRMGMNGTLTASAGQGVYSKMSEGITLNYRKKKLNIFGSYNYSYRKSFSNPVLYRAFLNKDTLKSAFSQNVYIVFPFHTQVARLGMDYNLSSKTIVGFVMNGLDNRFNPMGNNLSYVLDSTGSRQSIFTTGNHSQDKWHNFSVNGNLKHTFDSTGTELTVDMDYVRYWNTTYQTFTNDYYRLDGTSFQPTYILYSELPGSLDIKSVKADFTKPLKKESKIEAGFKSSLVIADNDLKFYDKSNAIPVFDSSKSNHFIYHENINAGYFNFYGKMKKLEYQLGFRAEQTTVRGDQLSSSQHFDTSYLQLFPSMTMKYTLSKNHEVGLSVSRRIERPTYKQLNPFKFYVDPTTYIEGNPYLLPQTSYHLEASYTFKQRLTTSFEYSFTKNNITEVLLPSTTQDKVTIQTSRNLADVQYYVLTISYAAPVAKWWTTTSSFVGYYGHYKGSLDNTTLNNGSPAFNVNSNNAFALGKGYNAEMNLVYRSGEVYGYYTLHPVWQLGIGVQKNIVKNKASIKLNVNDIFFTYVTNGTSVFTNYYETFVTTRETRSVTLSFTYRFGKTSVSPSRRRASGVEEEKSRASNGNG